MEFVSRFRRFIVSQFSYRPYFLKDGIEHLGYFRSKRSNPLVRHFDDHLKATYDVITQYRLDRASGRLPNNHTLLYSNREWYGEVIDGFSHLVNRVRVERAEENAQDWANGNADYDRPKVWLALLECACSLIIFSRDPRYRGLSNEDIECLLFPLSSWSRSVISGLEIRGHTVTARARVRTTL